ncbi:MAG: hypothetical protein ACLFQM_12430 [Fidelibacterota bacterium]
MRLISATINDVKIQFRSGFYYAYLFVCLFYILLIRQLPADYTKIGLFYVIFTDPTVLGFYFVGGLLLLEKGQKTLTSLFVTPMRLHEYILAKVLSLGLLALISSLAIAFLLVGFDLHITLLIVTVTLASAIYTLVGITLGVRARDVNRYLFISPLYLVFTILPVLSFLGLFPRNLFFFIPTHSILNLLHYAILDTKSGFLWLDIGLLILWTGIAWYWARKWFIKYVIHQTGD